mmetsp:Transcript_2679/g.5660  ORF Transcript_2679/g.5660 Transcript_2679/m.5660 type:complete len:81 (+) Transcript_2679:1947-2189(+)
MSKLQQILFPLASFRGFLTQRKSIFGKSSNTGRTTSLACKNRQLVSPELLRVTIPVRVKSKLIFEDRDQAGLYQGVKGIR